MKKQLAIVITLSEQHVHYCKALMASIMYFNPELDIIVLKDGHFNTNFLRPYGNIYVVGSEEINKLHGLDLYILLNKLNILFLPQLGFDYEIFFHLDADSILTNPITYDMFADADFTIFQGRSIDCSDTKSMDVLCHYAFNPADFNEYRFNDKALYYFSASHIAINKRIFSKLIGFLKVHRFELNKVFLNDKRIKFNDQGFFNLIVNYLSHEGEITVKLNDLGIYGKQNSRDFKKLTLYNIKHKIDSEVLFIHYTGPCRRVSMKAHNYGEILDFFLKSFYGNRLYYTYRECIRVVLFYKNWFLKRFRRKLSCTKNNWTSIKKHG